MLKSNKIFQTGFSLLELLVALAIFSAVTLGLLLMDSNSASRVARHLAKWKESIETFEWDTKDLAKANCAKELSAFDETVHICQKREDQKEIIVYTFEQ